MVLGAKMQKCKSENSSGEGGFGCRGGGGGGLRGSSDLAKMNSGQGAQFKHIQKGGMAEKWGRKNESPPLRFRRGVYYVSDRIFLTSFSR
jgi:hypothetical protein